MAQQISPQELEQVKQEMITRFKDMAQRLPPDKMSKPFIHILGRSLTSEQAAQEIEADSEIGRSLLQAELKRRGYGVVLI